MGWKFNPFTGSLDQTGSTPSSYIDGEVATYNDLPLSSTTAPLDSAWLVRGSSGVWPFTKPGGVYIRTATGGSSRDADYTYAGVFPDVFSDANFTLYDDSDTSKNLKFQLSGIPTATTRTVDAPAGSGRMLVEGQSIGSTTAAAGTFTSLKADSLVLPSTGAPLIYLNTSSGQVSASSFSAGNYTTSSGGTYTVASGGALVFNSGSSVTGQIVATNGTLTASAPVLDLSQTWNNAAVTFTGLKFNVTATAAASNSIFSDIQAGGYSQFAIARISSTSNACWIYNTNSGTNTNGVGANYERGFMRWSSNVLQIGTEKLGTGSARALEFQTDGTSRLTISTAGVFQFGGTTGSFPALKRSSTALQVRLADDSADAPLSASLFSVGSGSFDGVIGRPNAGVIGFARADGAATYIAAFGFDGTTRALVANSGAFIGWSSGNATSVTSGDTRLWRDAAGVIAQYNGVNAQAYRLYNTWSSTTSFERLNIRWATNECIIDAEAGSGGGTLRGIKIGSATSSLLGFYGATPVDRPATVADPTGGGTIDTEARTAINDIIDRLQELGLIA